jgi:hypothetical protein
MSYVSIGQSLAGMSLETDGYVYAPPNDSLNRGGGGGGGGA